MSGLKCLRGPCRGLSRYSTRALRTFEQGLTLKSAHPCADPDWRILPRTILQGSSQILRSGTSLGPFLAANERIWVARVDFTVWSLARPSIEQHSTTPSWLYIDCSRKECQLSLKGAASKATVQICHFSVLIYTSSAPGSASVDSDSRSSILTPSQESAAAVSTVRLVTSAITETLHVACRRYLHGTLREITATSKTMT